LADVSEISFLFFCAVLKSHASLYHQQYPEYLLIGAAIHSFNRGFNFQLLNRLVEDPELGRLFMITS
jgi:hypothetical protein